MKILRVGAELFHADGQTDITKLTVAFRNFSKQHENKAYRNQWRVFVNMKTEFRGL